MAFRWLTKITDEIIGTACERAGHQWGGARAVPVAVDLYGGGELRFRGLEKVCRVCRARNVDIQLREPERDAPKAPERSDA